MTRTASYRHDVERSARRVGTVPLAALLVGLAAARTGVPWAHAADSAARATPLAQIPRFPVHAPAPPAQQAAGKALFSANCSFCHGSNARGGESGPNLLRSAVVLNDQHGELIAPVVQNGRIDAGMPRFSLSVAQVADIAAFLHSFPLTTDIADVNPVIGDASAGQGFFNGAGHCSECHSVSGDLAGVGAKFAPRELQRALLTGNWRGIAFSPVPNMIPPGTTATVSVSADRSVSGRLEAIDEFSVSIIDAGGQRLTFERRGQQPSVQVHDPLSQHLAMWRTLTDAEIHDLTAYLVTLK